MVSNVAPPAVNVPVLFMPPLKTNWLDVVTEVVLKVPPTVTEPTKVVIPVLLLSVKVPLAAIEEAPCTLRLPVPPNVNDAKPFTLSVVVMVSDGLKAPVDSEEKKPPTVRLPMENAGVTSSVTVVNNPPVVTVPGELN